MDNILGQRVGKEDRQVREEHGSIGEEISHKQLVVARWDETTKDELPQLRGGPWPLPRPPAEPLR